MEVGSRTPYLVLDKEIEKKLNSFFLNVTMVINSLMNMTGHNTDLALAGGDDTGAVGTDQARLVLADQGVLHLK